MRHHRVLSIVILLLAVGNNRAFSQSDSLIQQEIDMAIERSLWRFGPFRLSPSLRVNAGYDSNAFSSAGAGQGDSLFRLAPGLRAATPIRNLALFDVFQEFNFVYYRKFEALRQVYPVTRVGGAIGGKRLVFRVDDELRKEKTRHTSEFDIPTDQKSNRFNVSLRMALGWRHQLLLGYQKYYVRLEETEAPAMDDETLQSRLNRTEDTYSLRLSRKITPKTSGVLEGFYELYDFRDKAVQRDAVAYGGVTGFTFTPRTNVSGQALIGYKQIIPDDASKADFRGLIGSVDTTMDLGTRLKLQALFSRDAIPSVFSSNWYFVENRFGGSLLIQVFEKFSIQPGVVVGRNTYPRPEIIIEDDGTVTEIQVEDDFETYSLSFNYRLLRNWTVRLIGNYLKRDSNFRPFTKDRFTVSFGIIGGIGG